MLRVYRGYVAITWLQSASKERAEDRDGGRGVGQARPIAGGVKIISRRRLEAITRLGIEIRRAGGREIRSPGIIIARAIGF